MYADISENTSFQWENIAFYSALDRIERLDELEDSKLLGTTNCLVAAATRENT